MNFQFEAKTTQQCVFGLFVFLQTIIHVCANGTIGRTENRESKYTFWRDLEVEAQHALKS